ncbi:MAG: hypothetical protein ACREIM_03490 [Nitrospiraceae bacterium]
MAAGHDAVISAFNPGWSDPDVYNHQVKGKLCFCTIAPSDLRKLPIRQRDALNIHVTVFQLGVTGIATARDEH